MSKPDKDHPGDRRGQIIGRLVQQYQSAPDPEKWLQAMTLHALRALDRAELTPGEKSPARREIHAIHREVAVRAKALKLSRSLAVITADRTEGTGAPGPVPGSTEVDGGREADATRTGQGGPGQPFA